MAIYTKNIIRCLAIAFLMTFFVCHDEALAQYIGTSTNYAGSRALAVNPSLMTTAFVYADFGLNLGASAYNDFAYLHASDYYRLLNGENPSDYYINGRRYDVGFLINSKYKNVNETFDFNLLSAMYNRDGKHAFGIFINNRVYTSAKRIPWEILEASLKSIDSTFYDRNYVSKNTRVSMMAWSEIGLSYASTVYDYDYDKVDFGITAKGLLGYTGVALNLNKVDKDIVDKNTSIIHSLNMMAAMSAPIDYGAKFSDGEIFDANQIVNGYGLGFDIGFTYTRKTSDKLITASKHACVAPKINYQWRLGVSLLDVGAISFKNNAKVYKFLSDTDKTFDVRDLEGSEDFNDMMDRLSGMFYDDPADADAGSKFMMGLPTAMSVQFDYKLAKNIYVNATWMQPLRLLRYSARRPAQVVVEPRFESRYFDLTMPVTFYNYEKIFLGAELRLAFLTVGTHNIFNFLGVGESYGLDAYVALKFNFYKGKCFGGRRDACWNANFQ